MNRGILHIFWLCIAIGAFIIGFKRFPASDSNDPAATSAPAQSNSTSDTPANTPSAQPMSKADIATTASDLLHEPKIALADYEIEALGEQLRGSNPVDSKLAFTQLLQGLTPENALLIRKQIEHLTDRDSQYREFHYAWGATAGKEAVLFGAETEGDDMSPALAGWASAAPDAAREWLQNVDMKTDPAFASLLKDREIPEDDLHRHLMHALVKGMANADPAMATSFIKDIAGDTNGESGRMMHTVAETVMRSSDHAETATWAAGIANTPEAPSVINHIGSRWASRDPSRSMELLDTLPTGEGQNAGMRGALNVWARKDPTAASEHLKTMDSSDAKDAAIDGFTSRHVREDPASAMAWAESIDSEELRTRAITRTAQTWALSDPEGAAAWLTSSGLPANVQQAILQPSAETPAQSGTSP